MTDTAATVISTLVLAGQWLFVGLVYFALAVMLLNVRREMLRSRERRAAPAGPGPGTAAAAALRVVTTGADPARTAGELLPLAPVTLIGAGEDSTLLLGDPYISGRHARLSRDATGWWVEDLGSANGTWVDGRPCRPGERCRLVRGGRLALGDMVLELAE